MAEAILDIFQQSVDGLPVLFVSLLFLSCDCDALEVEGEPDCATNDKQKRNMCYLLTRRSISRQTLPKVSNVQTEAADRVCALKTEGKVFLDMD